MESMRKFVRFRAFNREHLRLYRLRRVTLVRELSGPIRRWAGEEFTE